MADYPGKVFIICFYSNISSKWYSPLNEHKDEYVGLHSPLILEHHGPNATKPQVTSCESNVI
jgi:hypothetical protein